MTQGISCLVEGLEPRCLLSAAHHAVSGKTLAARSAAPAVTEPPAPTKRHHPAPAAPAPVFQVAGGLAGIWAGGESSQNDSFSGSISLTVFTSSTGDSYAILRFDRPGKTTVQLQSQFVVHPDGQFALQVITAKMAVKFTGTIFNHASRTSELPTMNGTLQYWDRMGTFKSDFALSSQNGLQFG